MRSDLLFFVSLLSLSLTACNGNLSSGIVADENLVGTPLQTVTQLTRQDGDEKSKVAIFDETTRRIHQFDLSSFAYRRSFAVQNPGEKHYLLYSDAANYVVDLTEKHFSIFDAQGNENATPVKLVGKPLSAAFRSGLGILVVYDDMMNVGLMKLSNDGTVEKSWVGGSLVVADAGIRAGDLLEDGRLLLALSDSSFAVIDVLASIDHRRWEIVRTFSLSLGSPVVWVAPSQNDSIHALVRTKEKLYLIDAVTGLIYDNIAASDSMMEKYSKTRDAHVLIREDDVLGNRGPLSLIYADGNVLKKRSLGKQEQRIIHSQLNIQKDEWSFVDAKTITTLANDLDQSRDLRTYKRLRLSDLAGLAKMRLPDRAQLNLSSKYIFALFPSELGYAARYSTDSDDVKVLKLFNRKFL